MAKKKEFALFGDRDKVTIRIDYVCPNTKEEAVVFPSVNDFRAYGGCLGGHGSDEYCYCNSPTPEITFECPSCGHNHQIELGY